MKKLIILLWLTFPVFLATFHFGPGQDFLQEEKVLDRLPDVYKLVANAEKTGIRQDWEDAVKALTDIIAEIPEDAVDLRRRLELDLELARVYSGDLVVALSALESMLHVAEEEKADEAYRSQLKEAIARTLFGITWVMRREGSPNREWQEVAQLGRQHFRWSADSAPNETYRQKDLETAIRMMLMDHSELMAKPLPKEGQGQGQGKGEGRQPPAEGQNGEGRGIPQQMQARKGRQGKGQGKPAVGEMPPDVRESGEGAGLAEMAKNRGS